MKIMNMSSLNSSQKVVDINDVSEENMSLLILALLEHMNLEIIEESTPDYIGYELRSKVSVN